MSKTILEALRDIIPEKLILIDEPMSKHTTFKIGGIADIYVKPESVEQIAAIIKLCVDNKEPYFILGNGSNLLVSDKGYRGVVIQIYNNMESIIIDDTMMKVSAGILLSKIANAAKENDLTGIEFAAGIPGTIGGGIVMNAGAYGGELSDIIDTVTVLDQGGNIITLSNEDMEFGYRTSIIEANRYIVIEATINLKKGDRATIVARMDELREARVSKQPLEYPSAGSTFKRPEGYFAGKLIMDAGLRGKSVGGAKISDKHCGFVINTGEATAKDVIGLIEEVTKEVENQYDITLETEVKMIGDFQ